MTRIRGALAALARYIVKREPVVSAGMLAGAALGAAAWFGFDPSSQQQQIVQTVCGVLAPVVTALLARLAAWSPASHVAAQADLASAHVLATGFPAAMVSQSAPAAASPAPLNGRLDDPPKPAKTAAKKAPAKKAPAKKPAAKKKAG